MNARALGQLLNRTCFLLSPEGFRVEVTIDDAKVEWGRVRVQARALGRDGTPWSAWVDVDRLRVDTESGIKSLLETCPTDHRASVA